MSKETKIQWCDSTVNPVMGCVGCELFPKPLQILTDIDKCLGKEFKDWKKGTAKKEFASLIQEAFDEIPEENRSEFHETEVSTSNIWHLKNNFLSRIKKIYGAESETKVNRIIQQAITCYAAKDHLRKGYDLLNPAKKINKGFAPRFETVTPYRGDRRCFEAAKFPDLLGKADPEHPWKERLPRMIFVSDMGDAFSREDDFDYLEQEVIEAIESKDGKRHLWLWLTKQPKTMAKFSQKIGGFPENVCVMTTVTGPSGLNRISQLKKVQASCYGLSLEPLWERIEPDSLDLNGIDWVIAGGEASQNQKDEFVRSFPVEWATELREHCKKSKCAFFLKQLGSRPTKKEHKLELSDDHGGDWNEWPNGQMKVREFPKYFFEYRKEEFKERRGYRYERRNGLTVSQVDRFKELDKKVNKFACELVVVADALNEIKKDKLYRARNFKTFSDYCESVHEMSRQYANRLIKAGEIRGEMETIVSEFGIPLPDKEWQLKELGRLEDGDARRQVYKEVFQDAASKSQKVTAKMISEAVDNHLEISRPPVKERPSPLKRISEAKSILNDFEASFKDDDRKSMELLLKKLKNLLG